MRWYLEALGTMPGLYQVPTTNTAGLTFIEQLFGARIFAHIPSHYFFHSSLRVNHIILILEGDSKRDLSIFIQLASFGTRFKIVSF